MTLKEKIRLALGIDTPETRLAYQDKLVDGTIITSEADELIAGSDVSVLTEDGTTIPLPIGEYETETEVKFRVDEEGIVAEVYSEETDEETEEAPEAEVAPEEEVEATDDRLPKKVKESREVEFDSDTMIAELSDAVKEMMAGMQTQIDEIRELMAGNTATLEEEIVSAETEKEELSKKVSELEKSAAVNPETMSKFSKSNAPKPISKTAYRNLSQKEKYWYNLEMIKN